MNHEKSVAYIVGMSQIIVEQAGVMIDTMIAQGKRPLITEVSKDIAIAMGQNKQLCYLLIGAYVKARSDLRIQMGPNGGIVPVVSVNPNECEIDSTTLSLK